MKKDQKIKREVRYTLLKGKMKLSIKIIRIRRPY